jgi:hypothetical protein
MGSAQTNFYNNAYSRAGYADMARDVQERWVAGDKESAVAAVTDEFVLKAFMIGTEDMVRARMRATEAAGVTTLRVAPMGETTHAQIQNLELIVELAR